MKLAPSELEIMHCFWHMGEATAPQIHRELAKRRAISYSAVKTVIDRLEEKGALERRKSYERAISYGPTIDKSDMYSSMLKSSF